MFLTRTSRRKITLHRWLPRCLARVGDLSQCFPEQLCWCAVLGCSAMSNSANLRTAAHWAPLSTGILQAGILDRAAVLQWILPTQRSNPGLVHSGQILYHLSHQGSPRILEWVACLFSRGSSWPRNQTRVSCIAGGFFTSWATREASTTMPLVANNWGQEDY